MIYEENRETFSKIATLYYLGDMSQEDIAEMFGISRFKVSRILKKCRDMNIVEFRINSKPMYYRQLESKLCEILNLKQVTIVPSGSNPKESKTNVGKASAKHLLDNLKDGMVVGFDWGTTLQTMVKEFAPKKAYPSSLFLQISGSVASQSALSAGYIDGHDIVKTVAQKAGANWSLFPAPYIVQNTLLKTMLLEEPAIKKHISLFPKIDIAFFGAGSTLQENRIPFYSNYLTKDECKKIARPLKDQGEIFSKTITSQGVIVPSILDDRVLTIDLSVLKKLPEVVVLASGNDKTESLIGGARGGYFSRMIIDEIAALSMLNALETT